MVLNQIESNQNQPNQIKSNRMEWNESITRGKPFASCAVQKIADNFARARAPPPSPPPYPYPPIHSTTLVQPRWFNQARSIRNGGSCGPDFFRTRGPPTHARFQPAMSRKPETKDCQRALPKRKIDILRSSAPPLLRSSAPSLLRTAPQQHKRGRVTVPTSTVGAPAY